ncbi:hypothetical protein [Azospirillum isscasi]|uniref:Uncharacterized protein n=1 Tax=Azospirillum isscasi TaxID=3053926 RepID=A0ABU0WR87_9PROT|nr:hypothetical protein [Azospirillum isscasi]MDQ2106754.1 hypothetical protein [Azospirillum isscasi]
MPARPLHHDCSGRETSGQPVNKFASYDDTRADARQRRDDDQRLAALLIEGGLTDADVHAAPPDSDDQFVATDDSWTESLGRALRRHAMFPSQAYRNKVRHGLCYTDGA